MSANVRARVKFRLDFGRWPTCNKPRRRPRAMLEKLKERGVSPAPDQTVVISRVFAAPDGKTRLTLQQNVSESLAKQTGAYPSWLEMLERLDDLLGERSRSTPQCFA
jgi:hypothetical protein